jgi:hypothetical protein
MTKKNIKVKKGKGDISITIENNLNANNKQINHNPIKRRRRKKKVENNDEINDETLQQSLQKLPPLKDTSYIKPGPVGSFKIWRDTMDSYNTTVPMNVPMNQAQQLGLVPPQLPAPPTQSAQPAPDREQQQMLTFDNFARILADAVDNQRSARPPPEWGRNLVDDDNEPRMPTSPAFSRLSKPSDLEFDIDFANELENSIAEVYGTDPSDPEIKQTGKEMQQIFNKALSASPGTMKLSRRSPSRLKSAACARSLCGALDASSPSRSPPGPYVASRRASKRHAPPALASPEYHAVSSSGSSKPQAVLARVASHSATHAGASSSRSESRRRTRSTIRSAFLVV